MNQPEFWEGTRFCPNCDSKMKLLPSWVEQLELSFVKCIDNYDNYHKKLLEAIPKGFVNWQHIYHQLCIHILEKECKNIDNEIVQKPIADIIALHKIEETDNEKWKVAHQAAYAACNQSQYSASASAYSAATAAAGLGSIKLVADTAARSAASYATENSTAEDKAISYAATQSAVFNSIANKLLEILEESY